MRVIQRFFFVMLISGLMAAQSTRPAETGASKLETDVQKLLDAVAAQQKAMADQQKQMAEQQKAMADQQKRISEQEQEITKLKQQLNTQAQPAQAASDAQPAQMVNASLTVPNTNPGMHTVSDMAQEKPKESPLSFRIGGAEFTPGGFVDFENVFRTTNTGNVAATNFWAIPFSNTVAGHLTEYRATGQYSRFNIKVTEKFGRNDMTGYVEFDFNGNDANNVFTTSNGHTDRLRLYWLDLKRGKWEFLGGQTWGLFTANRVGVSPNPADMFTTIGEDAQVHVGVGYTRAAEFRAAYHFNDKFVWAAAIENAQQFAGIGPSNSASVVFPAAFNAQLGSQFDNGGAAGSGPGNPNVAPDVITKLAWDSDPRGKHLHFELGGLMTSVKTTVLAPSNAAGGQFVHRSAVGGGLETGLSLDLLKGSGGGTLRFVGYGHWGHGIGRYLIGMGPQAVIVPVNAAGSTCTIVGVPPAAQAVGCDIHVSMVHSGDAITGFEFAPHPKSQFGVYYGGTYVQRNAFPDITSTSATKPIIGFGGLNSGNSNNRAIQEGTVDWTQTFWRNPQYGAVLLVTQASYVTRAPWFVSAGAPKNAHLMMGYVSLRYVLP